MEKRDDLRSRRFFSAFAAFAAAAFFAFTNFTASAAEPPKGTFEIELRMVPFDQPTITVDKLERNKPVINPVSTPAGIEMRQVGVDVVCWSRNVLLDDKPLFERYHDGKYIDRLPVARIALEELAEAHLGLLVLLALERGVVVPGGAADARRSRHQPQRCLVGHLGSLRSQSERLCSLGGSP